MTEKIVPYPRNLQELSVFYGFLKQFYVELRTAKTNKEAYEATESLHLKYYGRRKYSNYRTFTELRARKLRK